MPYKNKQDIPFSNAYIIHQKAYQENKLILTILSEEHGILPCIGSRGSKKKVNNMQLFSPLSMQIKLSNSLCGIKKAESRFTIPLLKGNSLWAGLYINELIYRLYSPKEPIKEVFIQYEETLLALSQSNNITIPIRKFEYTLLQNLGFSLNFSYLENKKTKWFYFDPDQGIQPSKTGTERFKLHSRDSVEQLFLNKIETQETINLIKNIFATTVSRLLGNKALSITKMIPCS